MLRTARANSNDMSNRNAICESVNVLVVLWRHNETVYLPDGTKVYKPMQRVHSISEVLSGDGDKHHIHDMFITRFKEKEHDARDANGANIVTMEPYLDMINIPFFGLELKDIGYQMPAR